MNAPTPSASLIPEVLDPAADATGSLRFRNWLGRALAADAALALRRAVPSGGVVYAYGAPDQALYLLVSGTVGVYLFENGADCLVSLAVAGTLFGESALGGVGLRPDQAVALNDVVVLRIERATLVRHLADPECLAAVLEHLGQGVRDGQARIAGLLPTAPEHRFSFG